MSLGRGRTSYYIEDQALHRRDLVMELVADHGGAAGYVYRILRDMAQEQRDPDGVVLTGFRSLATVAGVTPDECRLFVRAMWSIGLVDDYEAHEDGRRFTCRMSGWKADQRRGKDALKKADQRAASGAEPSPPEREPSPAEGEPSPNTKQSNTKNREKGFPPKVTYQGKPVPLHVAEAAARLLDEFNSAASRKLGAVTGQGQASESLKQIIGAVLQHTEVTVDEWEAAIRNTIANPPSWVEETVQLGDIFGPKAAAHALANPGRKPSTGPGRVSDRTTCKDCDHELKLGETVRCRDCERAIEERLTGAAA